MSVMNVIIVMIVISSMSVIIVISVIIAHERTSQVHGTGSCWHLRSSS